MIHIGRYTVLFMGLMLMKLTWAASLAGQWTTIDDKTGQPRSVIEISEQNGQYVGRVFKSLNKQPDDKGICEKCPGEFKNKTIQGLQIMWGLKQTSEYRYESGKILDPKGGSIYSCNITLAPDGESLSIRGYIGISLLGRSQKWLRTH